MSTVLPTAIGAIIILVVLRDAMHELFHPEESGSLSSLVIRGVWSGVRAASRFHHNLIYRGGPLILVAVMATWVVLLVAGFALIYLPQLPHGFNPNPALAPSQTQGPGTAAYISLASFTTISASDITPKTDWMRMLVAIESLVGPIIFTAWITWVLSIYPVLSGRRTFTREVHSMRKAWRDPKAVVRDEPIEAVTELLRSLTEQARTVGAQIQQTRVSYYFQNKSEEASLAVQLPYLLALSQSASHDEGPPVVRHYGVMLETTIKSLIDGIGKEFLGMEDESPERVISAMARDHLIEDPFAVQ